VRRLQVKDVMTANIKCVEIPGTRAEALDLLRNLQASAIPAVKRGTNELVGMISLRKLFENPDEEQLAMLVDRDVPRISPDDPLEEAARRILASHSRRLPVLKDGRLVGIITVRDIVYRAISKMNLERPASDYMNPNTIVIWDGTPLQAALEIMVLSRSRALPVIDEKGNLVGIVDDSDIVKVSDVETESKMSHMAGRTEGDSWTWDSEDRVYITKRKLKVPDKLVRDIMEKNLITITRKTSVSRCAELMKQHRIEQTPVVGADGRLVGVVHDADLLRALI
jgi:CBS domain-containing protein